MPVKIAEIALCIVELAKITFFDVSYKLICEMVIMKLWICVKSEGVVGSICTEKKINIKRNW